MRNVEIKGGLAFFPNEKLAQWNVRLDYGNISPGWVCWFDFFERRAALLFFDLSFPTFSHRSVNVFGIFSCNFYDKTDKRDSALRNTSFLREQKLILRFPNVTCIMYELFHLFKSVHFSTASMQKSDHTLYMKFHDTLTIPIN